jgi:tripartite-type tricarboxylate transporter receptor subunit TctC
MNAHSQRRTTLLRLASMLAAGGLLASARTDAQEADRFPNRPIKLLVGFTPGGAIDTIARAIAQKWAEKLGQPIVVDNRPGAGTIIATQALAKSTPDGYTLGFVPPTHAVNAALHHKLPYDTLVDFEPVGMSSVTSMVLVVHPSLNVKTLPELVALARSRPGGLNYYSSGAGTLSHLAAEIFKSMTKTDIVHVPFKGTADAVRDLLSGRVHMSIDGLTSLLPYIREGRLLALGVGTTTRSPLLPEVPTIDEAGLKGFSMFGWSGFLAPARTPKPVIDHLNATLNSVLELPEIRATLHQMATVPRGSSPEEFRHLIQSEIRRFEQVLTTTGIRKQ